MISDPRSGGLRVLVVEDEALIALALADVLDEAGYTCAGPFHRRSDALRWLEGHTPDLALLDVSLRDGSSVEVAEVLRHSRVPFLVYTGRSRDDIPPRLADAPWLEKPSSYPELLDALDRLARSRTLASPGGADGVWVPAPAVVTPTPAA